jgi:serine/threonine protein kinase
MLAQLQHPHILPVFDYGHAEGYSYIVMPLVQSGTLADLLKIRRMSPPEIRRIINQLGDALGYAHARGMTHRDVKPSNVLVDERENCLLTDFGLARMTAGSERTSAGAIMGTPSYMAPEQGSGSHVDGRSDIYSLGIMLYEMVTGRLPYYGINQVAVVMQHINEPVPPPSQFAPDVSDKLERVIFKVLAKDPAARYQKAEDFVQAVQQAIPTGPAGKPASAVLDSVYDRLLKKGQAARPEDEDAPDLKTFLAPPPDVDMATRVVPFPQTGGDNNDDPPASPDPDDAPPPEKKSPPESS